MRGLGNLLAVGGGETAEPDGAAIKIVVVEDHGAVRKGIELILRGAGCEIVGSAADAETALPLMRRRRPDVALIDVNLPGESGVELARRLAEQPSGPAVLLYTGAESAEELRPAVESDAAGIACKAGPPTELVSAVRTVAAGGAYFDPRLGALLADSSSPRDGVLSRRETEILDLLARGLTGEQVAAQLIVTGETVRTHVRNAMLKLGTRTRVHAITEAIRRGEIRLEE